MKSEWCARCGCRFDESMGYARSDIAPDLCEECDERVRELGLLHQSIRRLEAWADYEGSRENIARRLAEACQKIEPKSSVHHRWALIWETSGDRKELRKLIERLLPQWMRNGTHVVEPPGSNETKEKAQSY